MLLRILEGLGLGALLILICAVGICKGAGAVCEAGTYNPRENQAKFLDFQSRLRSRLYRLCTCLRLWDKRCKGIHFWDSKEV